MRSRNVVDGEDLQSTSVGVARRVWRSASSVARRSRNAASDGHSYSPIRRLVLLIPLAVAAFVVLVDPVRAFEARLTAAILGSRARLSDHATLIIADPGTVQPFAVQISRSCSALPIVLGAVLVGCSFLRSGLGRRLVAVASATVLALGVNALRAGGIVLVGRRRGTDDMVSLHDWVGTVVTVVTACLALALLLWIGTDRRPPGELHARHLGHG
jgi:exosortase/archaeosortase family protein